MRKCCANEFYTYNPRSVTFVKRTDTPQSFYRFTKPLIANKSNYLCQAAEAFLRITDRDDQRISFPSLSLPRFACFPCSAWRQTTSCLKQTRLLLARLVPWGTHLGGLIIGQLGLLNNSSEKFYCPRAFVNGRISVTIIHWSQIALISVNTFGIRVAFMHRLLIVHGASFICNSTSLDYSRYFGLMDRGEPLQQRAATVLMRNSNL
jgi:hypothetical protein